VPRIAPYVREPRDGVQTLGFTCLLQARYAVVNAHCALHTTRDDESQPVSVAATDVQHRVVRSHPFVDKRRKAVFGIGFVCPAAQPLHGVRPVVAHTLGNEIVE
jgi:hypothetical protein